METPVEIERKYVIRMPDISELMKCDGYSRSEITQIYLAAASDKITHRVRRRIYGETTVYTETKKIRIDRVSAYEDEHEITAEEFEAACKNIKCGTSPVNKTRHKFTVDGQMFEVDIYPEWKRTAIMETELDKRERAVNIPPFIEVILEVSGERAYSNAAMAIKFPPELV